MKPERGSGVTGFAGSKRQRAAWLCGLACLVAVVLLAGEGLRWAFAQQASDSLPAIDPPKAAAKSAPPAVQQASQPAQQGAQDRQQSSFSLPAIDPPSASGKPQAGSQNQPQNSADEQAAAADPNEPEAARECADLLKMATDLKAAVDKTTQDTLSVTVVRKANQIEEFARKVRLGSGKS